MSGHIATAPSLRRLVIAWFALDAVLALAPPLYWTMDGKTTPVLGIPAALFYFLAVGLCITASLIVAWLVEPSDEEAAA
ncbi:hypothetical protein [Methylobacterium gnaphalii]|uniref:DUF3311 domain-containing protein n=1 Tax=Methylobacterium gnaphalii TaxID=1010610 RepID=A0A512JGL8_9HYPH|nr:hypothetical protein [Methylobacterium gnaphalii]GEP08992.1 hypothetical protein MGN01_08370 [Methylobacterium gnaphalii]GJD67535.1 hypothetical protein MMMDOFMJ_0450 [Methylobacterium gnaphalii]GLS51410.1 hypothetical protein GCM10007885_42670 [Methylobacterium gnaphalii]